MRNQWYGDNRDVVKWSTVVHLARREGISALLHVAMLRPDQLQPTLATSRGKVDPPVEVIRHFRDLEDIRRLGATSGLTIEVLMEPFRHRAAYFGRLCRRLRTSRDEPMLVLLDPDIGLAPETPGPEHVTSAEVAAVFDALQPGDVLVCYQHARRHKDWRGQARRAFANAPGLPSFEVEVLQSELAKDVLMLAVKKTAAVEVLNQDEPEP
jgi:hypothetical protein